MGEAERQRVIELPDGGAVRSVWSRPTAYRAGQGTALLLAHGAGSDMDAPVLVSLQQVLTARGVLCVRFNFPYRERGARLPDRAPVLEQTWRAVIAQVRGDARWRPGRLFLGGRSMGGRMASHVAAAGDGCDGLVMLGYPLHPARKPERLRTKHFPQLHCPSLFVQGDRDALCDLERLRAELRAVPGRVRLHILADADHSFQVRKRSGRTEEDVLTEVATVVGDWIG